MAELNFDVALNDNQHAKQDGQNLYPSFGGQASQNSGNAGFSADKEAGATQAAAQPPQSKIPLCGFLNVEFYQPYFNVNTKDVQERVKASVIPFRPTFFEVTKENPDLYGPVWIYTTLVLVLAAAGNFSKALNPVDENSDQYDYSFVPTAAALIYGYGFIFPVLLTLLLKVFGSNSSSYVQTICCYGYSFAAFIPVFILAVIPVSILQWILIIYATASSTLFLITNYGHELGRYVGKQRYILLGFIGVAQFSLLLIFKLYFFKSFYE